MSLLKRAVTSLRSQGLGATLLKLWGPVVDRQFDRKYGVDTCGISPLAELTIDSPNKEHGAPYQPTRVLPLRKLFPVLRPLVPADSVFVDLGCGKGRVLLLAAQHGFREVRGLEFARELCQIAQRNWATFEAKTATRTKCHIIQTDVTAYTIQPEENVFFLFNPFDEIILGKVLLNLAASLRAAPRKVVVLFYFPSPACREVIARHPELLLVREQRFWGCNFALYSNRT